MPRSASKRLLLKSKSEKVYEGAVTKLFDFGALVNLLPGKDGLLHISQIAHERVRNPVPDYLQEGQVVKVKVLETDEKGRVKLSMKALIERPEGMPKSSLANVVSAAIAVIVASAVTVAIVVIVVSVRPRRAGGRGSGVLKTSRLNNSSSDRHEEAGCWKLEDARQPCI